MRLHTYWGLTVVGILVSALIAIVSAKKFLAVYSRANDIVQNQLEAAREAAEERWYDTVESVTDPV